MPGRAPFSVAFRVRGSSHTSCHLTGLGSTPLVITAESTCGTSRRASRSEGSRPVDTSDLDITPDGKFLYVIGGSQLEIVERTAGAVVRTVTLGGAAWKIAMSQDGIAVISNFDFNSGWVDFVR